MLHAGLDLSRGRVDVCVFNEDGDHLDQLAAPPDADTLRGLASRIGEVYGEPVCAGDRAMTGGPRFYSTSETRPPGRHRTAAFG
jgi:hypothetical protein